MTHSKKRLRLSRIPLVGLLLSGIFVLVGCDNTIEPVVADPDVLFVVNGYLDTAADTQFVRIEALRSTVLGDQPDLDQITVVSNDREGGETTEWEPVLVMLDDDTIGHGFQASFKPIPGHTIDLQLLKNGTVAASAHTNVPDTIAFSVQPPVGDSIQVIQSVILSNVFVEPAEVLLRYEIVEPNGGDGRIIEINYGRAGKPDATGWTVDVFLKTDQLTVLNRLGRDFDDKSVVLRNVSMRVTRRSAEWAEQGTDKNLEGATGLFASVARLEHVWRLNRATMETIGFREEQ